MIGDIVLKKDAPRYIQMLKDQHKETLFHEIIAGYARGMGVV